MTPQARNAVTQEVTNALLLQKMETIEEKLDDHFCADEKVQKDHEERLRKLEEQSTVQGTILSIWNGINSVGLLVASVLKVLL